MTANAVFLSNLPKRLSDNELREWLLEQPVTKNLFSRAFNENTLDIKTYHQDDPKNPRVYKTVAIICGFSINFWKICRTFRKLKIQSKTGAAEGLFPHRGINVKIDTGETRQSNGEFFTKNATHIQSDLLRLVGIYGRPILGIFSQYIIEHVPEEVFNGKQWVGYIHSETYEKIDDEHLRGGGYLKFKSTHYVGGVKRGRMLKYGSLLELLQAILYLNNNKNVGSLKPPLWTNNEGTKFATCKVARGLGRLQFNKVWDDQTPFENFLLPINDYMIKLGYVPLDVIDPLFIDMINVRAIPSQCVKCETPYRIVGIDADLNYLAGKCRGCKYDGALDINNEKRATFWFGEKFSRLIPSQSCKRGSLLIDEQNRRITFEVALDPVLRKYERSTKYREIMIPMLYHESKFTTKEFANSAVVGEIKQIELVETILDPEKCVAKYFCSIVINVPASEMWKNGNPRYVDIVKLKNTTSFGGGVAVEAKVYKMSSCNTPAGAEGVDVFLKARVPSFSWKTWLSTKQTVEATPIPCSSEFKETVRNLNEWIGVNDKRKDGRNAIEKLMLGNDLQKKDFEIKREEIPVEKSSWKDEIREKFTSSLNAEQVEAFEKAEKFLLSFIHGFPGSGKTRLIATIILYLFTKEHGKILVTAPSNFACEQLTKYLALVGEALELKDRPQIIRIVSRNVVSTEDKENKSDVKILSQELKEDDDWLNENEVRTTTVPNVAEELVERIIRLCRKGRQDLLTSKENWILEKHRRNVEDKILDKCDIIVTTVGSLSSGRIKEFADSYPVTTIILDEAGQLTHPATLLLSAINHSRCIIAGDPLQLQPSVTSPNVELAKYGMSLIEAVAFKFSLTKNCPERKFEIPWTTLIRQFRMHYSIYEVVGSVAYNGYYQDASTREQGYFKQFCDIKNQTLHHQWQKTLGTKYANKRVIVLNHNGDEQQIGTKIFNSTEVQLIKKTVQGFIDDGVPAKFISVISMYDQQKLKIIEALKDVDITVVDVGNTDAVQGRENEVVILSLVRSNDRGDIGFLKSINRLNVGLSRAKSFLIIPCNWEFYRKIELQQWKNFVTSVELPHVGNIVF